MRANLTDITNPNAVKKNSGHTLKIHLIAVGYLILSLEITYSRKIQLDRQNFLIIYFMINFRQKVTIQLMLTFQVMILSTLSLTKTR